MYDHPFPNYFANHQIRHQTIHTVGSQPGDFIWSLIFVMGLCGYVWVNILASSPQRVGGGERGEEKEGGRERFDLHCLMTPGLSKHIQCHVWPSFSKLLYFANHQIRHPTTHKVGSQPGDCIWSLWFLSRVCVGMYGLIYFITPEGRGERVEEKGGWEREVWFVLLNDAWSQ